MNENTLNFYSPTDLFFNNNSPIANQMFAHSHPENLITKSNADTMPIDISFACPKCFYQSSERVNWCSLCGELLIGANLSKCQDTEGGPDFLHPLYPHFAQGSDLRAPHIPTLSNSSDPPFPAPSLSLPNQTSQCDEFSFLTPKHASLSYVAETSIPYSTTFNQLHARFGDFHFESAPKLNSDSLQHVNTNLNGLVASVSRYSASDAHETASFPLIMDSCDQSYWNHANPILNSLHSAGISPQDQQNCVSIPAKHFRMPVNQGRSRGDALKSSHLDVADIVSPSNDHNSQKSFISWYGLPAGNEAQQTNLRCETNLHQKSKNVPFQDKLTLQLTREGTSLANMEPCLTKFVRPGTHRRKYMSECLRFPVCNGNSISAFHRARSASSNFNSILDSNFESNQPPSFHHPWQSSRIAWSVHNPVLLRKKPASYFQATENYKSRSATQRESNVTDHRGTATAIPLCHRNNYDNGLYCSFNSNGVRSLIQRQHESIESSNCKLKKSDNSRKLTESDLPTDVMKTKVHTSSKAAETKDGMMLTECVANMVSENSISYPDWLSLPDELWLAIFRRLCPNDRVHFAQTCRHMANLMLDRSLWRIIHVHRNHNLTDSALLRIASLQPKELRLSYCRGDSITVAGLKQMFIRCGPGLQKLSLIGCTKGPFDYDLPLRLVADYCHNLQHVNASYTESVRDQTVIALAKSATHLVSVKLNGARQISNAAIQQLVHYHESTLERLELFGCFRLNSKIFGLLGRCQKLRALAFGHLHHLSSDGLLGLVSKLPHLVSLDLRGTQTLGDPADLPKLAANCPYLEEIVLANMLSLRCQLGIVQMIRNLPRLRVLDLCGLPAVGDWSMQVLVSSCPQLENLDVSCTSVNQDGLRHLTKAINLRCLRISHCREVTQSLLEELVQSCPKLNLLYAYGFNSISDWTFLQKVRSTLVVQSGI